MCWRDQEDAKSAQKCGCYCNAFHSFLLGSEIRTTQTSHRAQADRRFMSRQFAFTSGRLDQSRVRAAVRQQAFACMLVNFSEMLRDRQKGDVGLWECSACRQHACCPLSPERKFGTSVERGSFGQKYITPRGRGSHTTD